MKLRTTFGWLLAVVALIAAGVWAASEDANPEKHSRVVLVDTSGEEMTPALEVGEGLTYTRVKIDQAGAGIATLLAKATGKTARLHALVGTIGATGTVTICYDNDGAGTSQVALTGNMGVAALGGMVIPFNRDPASALATAAGKQLTLVTTGGAFDGYAVVSTD